MKKELEEIEGKVAMQELAVLMGLAVAPMVMYCAINRGENENLKKQAYQIADTNHNQFLEDSELVQLAKGMGLIKEGEIIPVQVIRHRIDDTGNGFADNDGFKRYLDKQKKN